MSPCLPGGSARRAEAKARREPAGEAGDAFRLRVAAPFSLPPWRGRVGVGAVRGGVERSETHAHFLQGGRRATKSARRP